MRQQFCAPAFKPRAPESLPLQDPILRDNRFCNSLGDGCAKALLPIKVLIHPHMSRSPGSYIAPRFQVCHEIR